MALLNALGLNLLQFLILHPVHSPEVNKGPKLARPENRIRERFQTGNPIPDGTAWEDRYAIRIPYSWCLTDRPHHFYTLQKDRKQQRQIGRITTVHSIPISALHKNDLDSLQ